MRLYSAEGMGQGAGLCCRQSRLQGIVGGLIVCAVTGGGALLFRHLGAPRLLWGGIAGLAALVAAIFLLDVFTRVRPTNWVLEVHPDGLRIHLRPLQPPPTDGAATALHVSYSEIDRVHRHIDTWSTPTARGSQPTVLWKQESLDLHLASGDTRELSP